MCYVWRTAFPPLFTQHDISLKYKCDVTCQNHDIFVEISCRVMILLRKNVTLDFILIDKRLVLILVTIGYEFRVRLVAGTTCYRYDLDINLKNRVRVGSPDFRVRLCVGNSFNFPKFQPQIK